MCVASLRSIDGWRNGVTLKESSRRTKESTHAADEERDRQPWCR
jgi:hypothetical protein